MRVYILVFLYLMCFGVVKAQFSLSAQGSFLHFLGETKLKHFGGGVKAEYEYNTWAGIYAGVNLYSKSDYTGIVFAEAWGPGTYPEVASIPTPSSIYFTQLFLGTRVYFLGEIEADVRGGFAAYGIGELSLLIGTGEGEISSEGYDLEYNVPVTGHVEGSFYNYTATLGIGVEKPIGKALVYADAKFNLRMDEANGYEIKTDIPFGLSYFVGIRYPLMQY